MAPGTRTFAFRGNEILIREPELALPDEQATAALGLAEARLLPVGLHDGIYCQAAWLEKDFEPRDGFAFRGLRSLFGRMDGRCSPWRAAPSRSPTGREPIAIAACAAGPCGARRASA